MMLNSEYDYVTKHSHINNNDLYNKSETQFNTVHNMSDLTQLTAHLSN